MDAALAATIFQQCLRKKIVGFYHNMNGNVNTVPVLEVNVVEAKNLRNMDLTGQSDPFCKPSMLCHTGGEIFTRKFGETAVVKNCLNPVWNETFRLPISALQGKDTTYFIIEVYDRDTTNADDLLGSCRVFLQHASKKTPIQRCMAHLSQAFKCPRCNSSKVKCTPSRKPKCTKPNRCV